MQSAALLIDITRLFLGLSAYIRNVEATLELEASEEARPGSKIDRRLVTQQNRKFFKFVTRPDIDAPLWNMKVYDNDSLAPGYLFLAPYQDLDQKEPGDAWVGPHIYDGDGQLIWSGSPLFAHWNTFDFGVTKVGGKDMLQVLYAHGSAGVILDDTYQVHQSVALGDEVALADMHSFHVIDDGRRALVITRTQQNVSVDRSAMVGFEGNCLAGYGGFQEVDLEAGGKVVFNWNADQHIGLHESTFNTNLTQEMCRHGWDILHLNSIDKFPDGDYLLSSRHTDTIYKISHIDGSIIWRLGGVKSDFVFGNNAKFSRQHHARFRGQDEEYTWISLFDNAIGTGPEEKATHDESRSLILALQTKLTSNTQRKTAEIVSEYRNPNGMRINSRGSFELLPNGNAFVCWTYSSHVSEHSPSGAVVMDAALRVQAHTYRAFKFPWVGRPTEAIAVVSRAFPYHNKLGTRAYVSWNGATEVKTWNLYETEHDGSPRELIATAIKVGFETVIRYEGHAPYVVIEGLDINGVVLGKSRVVHTLDPNEDWTGPLGANMAPQFLDTMAVANTKHNVGWQPVEDALGASDGYLHRSAPAEDARALARYHSLAVVVGFLTCGLVAGLVWSVMKWRSASKGSYRWRRKAHDYSQVHQADMMTSLDAAR